MPKGDLFHLINLIAAYSSVGVPTIIESDEDSFDFGKRKGVLVCRSSKC